MPRRSAHRSRASRAVHRTPSAWRRCRDGPSTPRSMASTTRGPKTMPSSSEFDASRLAPCTPLHATSPATQSPGSVGGAVEVGDDAAAAVVGGRRDGQPVGGRVEADLGERRHDRGEPLGEALEAGGVEPEVVDALLEHAGGDGPAHLVARQQLVDEAVALGVAEQRAVAAQRLRQQRPGHGRVVERGRVELLELDVGHGHAGPDGHGHAVAGGLGRVGGDGEELAEAAGGQEHVGGPHLAADTRRRRRRRRRGSGRPRRAGRGRTSPRAPRPRWPARRRRACARSRRRWPRPRRGRSGAASGRPRGRAGACRRGRGRTWRRARSARGRAPGPRRRAPARRRRRRAPRRRPGCRRGGGRWSRGRRRARRPRRPGPSGWWPAGARPW